MPVNIKASLKKMLPHLIAAHEADLNEADTVQRLIMVLSDVLGYSLFTDISRETAMKGKYVDIALKIDGQIRLLVEAKSAGTTLRERHIEQAEGYASRNNFRWVLLTNGVHWYLYHLTFEEGIESERAFSVDLTKDPFDKVAQLLGLLHKNAIRRNAHEDFWRRKKALSAASIGRAVFQDSVLQLLRREIRKQQGFSIDEEDLAAALYSVFSVEAQKEIGPLKIRKTAKAAAPRKPRVLKKTPGSGLESEVIHGAEPTSQFTHIIPIQGDPMLDQAELTSLRTRKRTRASRSDPPVESAN